MERTLWITRVPATITEVKDLLGADIELEACTDARYSYHEVISSYGGIEQKWALIQSEEMKTSFSDIFTLCQQVVLAVRIRTYGIMRGSWTELCEHPGLYLWFNYRSLPKIAAIFVPFIA